jgi:hypothetical protein
MPSLNKFNGFEAAGPLQEEAKRCKKKQKEEMSMQEKANSCKKKQILARKSKFVQEEANSSKKKQIVRCNKKQNSLGGNPPFSHATYPRITTITTPLHPFLSLPFCRPLHAGGVHVPGMRGDAVLASSIIG